MENFRISQRQDKLTAPFHVKSPCLTRVPSCGLKYFYFQTQWMNDQCYWSNLWVLNKSIHRLSSTGIKTSRGDARLPLHELDVHSCCVLSFLSMMPCETESEAATHDLSKQHPYPQMLLWLISEKKWCVPEPNSHKDSSQIHLFPCFRVLSDKFCVEVWQSGHLWGIVLHFSGLL